MTGYYLEIGGTEIFDQKLIADLASDDADAKKKAGALSRGIYRM